ncbi:MAG: 16S rRNA (guanine(966)-N(2))-methyltransferase RsmD [Magnetococcales bacterium]|nr:16S rRNA (guanine(966)-N(2))-methyltransferase RsmD [Magnetococcales bacterium]
MRITGGEWRGRRVKTPPGDGTRPTSERVRESLFDLLGGAVVGARVMDLFAGSGALGLEALSRGASRALLVERTPATARLIRENIALLGAEDRARVIQAAADSLVLYRNLRQSPPENGVEAPPFDLFLLDPPYRRNLIPATLEMVTREGFPAPGAVAAAEHEADLPPPALPRGWNPWKHRRYGETALSLWTWEP